MDNDYHYEFPLSEFIRNCIKVDRLEGFLQLTSGQESETETRNLLTRMLEIHKIISRPEFKNELIKEAEKRVLKLNKLKNSPNINSTALSSTIESLYSSLQHLKSIPSNAYTNPLPYLIDSVKQRLSVPGGQFEFDLPMLQYWLNANQGHCGTEILNTIANFNPIVNAAQLLLKLLRQSAIAKQLSAINGIYQLTDNNNYELIIIGIPKNLTIFPEISGSRHRVFIRFLKYNDAYSKSQQTNTNTTFSLTCCRI